MGRSDEERDDDEPMFEFGDQDYGLSTGWEPPNRLKELLDEDRKKNPRNYAPRPDMIRSLPAAEWLDIAVQVPPVEALFGPFWRRGELAILFSGTGLGKSALATQIAESLARGIALAPFDCGDYRVTGPQKVLYLDCELDLDQFAARYSVLNEDGCKYEHRYQFSPDLIRSELSWDGKVINGYSGFSDMFFCNIAEQLDEHDSRVLIVDNITFLDRRSTSNANIALSIMRALSMLKRDDLISILVLAHTPKRRPFGPLDERDLQGSINLANFADSVFAMGRSRQSNSLRYLKQIKVRSGRLEYESRCVPVFNLGKFDNASVLKLSDTPSADNFLGLKFVNFARESEHLDPQPDSRSRIDKRLDENKAVIKNAKQLAVEGKSVRSIARKLKISTTTAFRYVKEI